MLFPKTSLAFVTLLLMVCPRSTLRAELPPGEYENLLRNAREVYQIRIVSVEETEKSSRDVRDFICRAEVLVVERTLLNRKEGETVSFQTYSVNPDAWRRGFVGPQSPSVPRSGWIGRIYLEIDRNNRELRIAAYGRSFVSLPRQSLPDVAGQTAFVKAWNAELKLGEMVVAQIPFGKTSSIEQSHPKYCLVTMQDKNGKSHRGWVRRSDLLITARLTEREREFLDRADQDRRKLREIDRDFVASDNIDAAREIAGLVALVYGESHPLATAEMDRHVDLLLAFKERKDRFGSEVEMRNHAANTCRQWIEFETESLGDDHPHLALAWLKLGDVLVVQKNSAEAIDAYRHALEILQSLPEADRSSAGRIQSKLASLLIESGRLDQAVPLLENALADARKNARGLDDDQSLEILLRLATLYSEQNEYRKAESLYAESLAACLKQGGKNHPRTAEAFSRLQKLYEAMGDKAKAEQLTLDGLTPEKLAELIATE